jgi:outer membrane protein OmpA-like peptidoglycan-associated protein
MSQGSVSFRPLRRALVPALIVSLIPLGTAFAQSAPLVRVTREGTRLTRNQHGRGDLLMVAPAGTLLEVVHTDGDRYHYSEDNWYLVMLPPDAWGTRPGGWVSGRDVEYVPPVATTATPAPTVGAPAVERMPPPSEPAPAAQPQPVLRASVPASAPSSSVGRTTIAEVILHFEFDKSDLTGEARSKLADAVTMLEASVQSVSFALEGHADWTGAEQYNERLGLARAEAVKQHLIEQHNIAADKISVVSLGESQPAASNATREGRAENRRVVVRVEA